MAKQARQTPRKSKAVRFFTGEMDTARLDRLYEQGLISQGEYRKAIGLTRDGDLSDDIDPTSAMNTGTGRNASGTNPNRPGIRVESKGGFNPNSSGVNPNTPGARQRGRTSE
jgi:hypothetical protein